MAQHAPRLMDCTQEAGGVSIACRRNHPVSQSARNRWLLALLRLEQVHS